MFCCPGCKAVYELLHAAELGDYYRRDAFPGLKPESSAEFAYLDDPDVARQLLDFSDRRFSRITFTIPQMHCASCIWLLENLYRLKDGVSRSTVNFPRRQLTVLFEHDRISLRQLVELLTGIGYEPVLRLDQLDRPKTRSRQRSYALKIGVAGFCFGNIMLLSFPHYLGADELVNTAFPTIFKYVMLALALPVLFYSASEYFRNAWSGLRSRMLTIDFPLALGIAALFGRSLFDIITGIGPGYLDSFSGLVFFLLIGRFFQQRTYDQLSFDRDYKAYFPAAVTRKTPTGETSTAISKLALGDRIIVRHGELIPADSILIDGDGYIDYSFVTGEAAPQQASSGDRVQAGGRQMGTAIEVEVVREVSQSYLTSLWNSASFQTDTPRTMTSLADYLSRWFTAAVLTITAATFAYWVRLDSTAALNNAVAVLVVACPCALALASPFILSSVMRVFGRHGLYLKNPAVAEAMAAANTIVFDKTGTLTSPEPTDLTFDGAPLTDMEQRLIKALVRNSTHPVSRRIEKFVTGETLPVQNYDETPGQGITGTIDNHTLHLGRADWVADAGEMPVNNPYDRTPATYLTIDRVPRGRFLFGSAWRDGVAQHLPSLTSAYRVAVLSGDTDRERPLLEKLFGADTGMAFNQSPHDKLARVERLQADGHSVIMIGDGLNDAGALRAADVGIAVSDDTAGFSPACDAILDAGSIGRLPRFLRLSRLGVRLIQVSFVISLAYNIVGLGFAVTGHLSPLVSAILMPISSISVVGFATLATSLASRRTGL